MPASADTAFWFTCDFVQETGIEPISFGMFANTGDGMIALGRDADLRPIVWYELGNVTHIFLDDVNPTTWVLSFDPEGQDALAYAEAHVTASVACRGGAE
jgi:hypothetical protein